jgi:hypothetical protein
LGIKEGGVERLKRRWSCFGQVKIVGFKGVVVEAKVVAPLI